MGGGSGGENAGGGVRPVRRPDSIHEVDHVQIVPMGPYCPERPDLFLVHRTSSGVQPFRHHTRRPATQARRYIVSPFLAAGPSLAPSSGLVASITFSANARREVSSCPAKSQALATNSSGPGSLPLYGRPDAGTGGVTGRSAPSLFTTSTTPSMSQVSRTATRIRSCCSADPSWPARVTTPFRTRAVTLAGSAST